MFKLDGSRGVTGDILRAPGYVVNLGSPSLMFKSAYLKDLIIKGVCDFYSGGGYLTLPLTASGLDMSNEVIFDEETSKLWVYNAYNLMWEFVQLG